jgi:hypothetical protein
MTHVSSKKKKAIIHTRSFRERGLLDWTGDSFVHRDLGPASAVLTWSEQAET